jgi:predicted  nucleic acid-binding Zn-ribbon protein
MLDLWVSMHPDTHLVIQLQSLDQKISALDKGVAALPKHIAAIEKTLESHLRKIEADRAALAANQKDRKKQEVEIQIHDQKISKLKDQMLGAKTNEQYRAFQNEIDFAQNEIRKCEDRILQLMTESEPLDQNLKTAEAALKEEKLLVEAEKDRAGSAPRRISTRSKYCAGNAPKPPPNFPRRRSRSTNASARSGAEPRSPRRWRDAATPARSSSARNTFRICGTARNC